MGTEFEWKGDLNDDCSCRTEDNYLAHVECMGHMPCDECGHENETPSQTCEECGATLMADWFFCLSDEGAKEDIFHSTEENVTALTGDSARELCEMMMVAHRAGWRR